MPIQAKVKTDAMNAIKSADGTLKYRVIALYRNLLQTYTEDDKYTRAINKETYESHKKIKELATKAIAIMRNQCEGIGDIDNSEGFFTEEELNSKEFNEVKAQEPDPDFWFNMLHNTPKLMDWITFKDEELLEYLDNIETFRKEDSALMCVEFTFRPNPYFKNHKLRITSYEDEDDDIEITKIRSDLIKWKPGMNYLVTTDSFTKKGKLKVVEKRHISFFWIFKNYNANDFDPYSDDFDAEPHKKLTDEYLFNMTCDVLYCLINDFFAFAIPTHYGIEVPQLIEDESGYGFQYDDDDDDGEYVDCESDEESEGHEDDEDGKNKSDDSILS